MQSAKISTSWGPSRVGSLTPPRRRQVPTSPSLPRRGRRRGDRRQGVVERVIDQGDNDRRCSVFVNEWTLLMRVNLQALRLWHAIEPEEGEMTEFWGGSAGIRCHITICAPREAHRAIGLGGNQIPSGRCTASARIQHRAAVEGALGDPL